jgi:hypothetical protein
MEQHIQIATATRKKAGSIPELPPGAVYSIESGCWTVNDVPLVILEHLGPLSSKKADMETGEDQKGE